MKLALRLDKVMAAPHSTPLLVKSHAQSWITAVESPQNQRACVAQYGDHLEYQFIYLDKGKRPV